MNIELLNEMGTYLQKSKTFLWPLVNLPITPIETYLKFGDIDLGNSKILIALFHNSDENYVKLKPTIETNKFHEFTFVDDEFDIVTFNFYTVRLDYDKIVKGEYSKISENFKLLLTAKERNQMVVKCLYPAENYIDFAEELGINPEDLEGKELLSPPSDQSETVFVVPSIKDQILEEYGLLTKEV